MYSMMVSVCVWERGGGGGGEQDGEQDEAVKIIGGEFIITQLGV